MGDKFSPSPSPSSSSSTVWREYHGPSASMIKRTNVPKVPRPKRYPCPGCDRLFDRPSTLSLHILTHTGERPHPCPLCQIRRFATVSNLNRHMKTCRGYASPSSSESPPDPASHDTIATTPSDSPEQALPETKPIAIDTYCSSSTPTPVPQTSQPLQPLTSTDPFATTPSNSSFYRQLSSLSHWNVYQEPDRSAQLQQPPPNQDGNPSSSNLHSNSMVSYGEGESYLYSHIASSYNQQQLAYPDNDPPSSSMCAPIQIPQQMMMADARASSTISASTRFSHMRGNNPSGIEQNPAGYTHINNNNNNNHNNSFYSLSSARDEEHALLGSRPSHHDPQNHHQNSRSMPGTIYGMTSMSSFADKQGDEGVWIKQEFDDEDAEGRGGHHRFSPRPWHGNSNRR